MSLTYDEILDSMKIAFQNEKGETVKGLSDLEMRFKAVASEIYSICAFGDFILKQGFPQTATGEYLEKHGAVRGIIRKTASLAKGTLTFSLSEAAAKDVTVPAGTVCSVSGKPFIQFSTDKAVKIKAGTLSVSAAATALKAGSEHNVQAEMVTVLVNPPANVYSVTNEQPFTGGWDAESDEALRERIISSYNSGKNSVSVSGARNILLSIEEVTDVRLYPEQDYVLHICLKTKSGKISSELKTLVSDMLGFTELCSTNLVFISATEQPFYAVAEVKALSGYDATAIKAAVKERITEFCRSEKIGQNYSESAVASACGNIDGAEYVHVFFGSDDAPSVSCGNNSYLSLKSVEVIVHE
ncbi:MAG: baseplate J/gp47 family protein [Eubacterium sp.]|nr:baseplate J/gp47 family protein [Eubacterium sp.]